MNPSIHRITHNSLDSCAQRNFFFGVLARGALESQQCGPPAGKLWRPLYNIGDQTDSLTSVDGRFLSAWKRI